MSGMRVGIGYDSHRYVAGRPLVLGGVRFESPWGLEGHSDADVLLHSLGDALLGAAGLGDLGAHFPPGDAEWKDASSVRLLELICEKLRSRSLTVVNCDLTLIAEAPMLAPYRERIRGRIASILGVEIEQVSLKATTNEGLGALGRGEGMAALAVALLSVGEE